MTRGADVEAVFEDRSRARPTAPPQPPPDAPEPEPQTPEPQTQTPATPEPVAEQPVSFVTEKWGLQLGVVVVGMFMSVLDTSIVNVAIPNMQKEFGSSLENIEWVTTAYTLALGVIVPTSSWLGERIGMKRLYLISLLGFSLFSAACGMAGNLDTMIVFRVLQALPAGVIPVTCMTILLRIVPPAKLGMAMGMYGLGIVVAPGVGPTIGGYLVEYFDWRLIYYINVPVGVLGAIAAVLVLPRFPTSPGKRFDLLGFVCIAAGLFCLLLAVSEGTDWGWTGYRILMLLAAGVDLLVLFAVVELHKAEPLLDVRPLTRLPFLNSMFLVSVLFIGLFAGFFYIPVFLQQGQDLTAMNTGLTILPQAAALVIMTPLAGRIYDRFGARWLAVIGLGIDGVGTLLLANINADMTRSELSWWMVIRAAGVGLAMMPIITSGIAVLPPSLAGPGSTFTTLSQRVAAALGLAALTALATSQQAQLWADRRGLNPGFGLAEDSRVQAMSHAGPGGLIPLWQQWHLEIEAQAYSNVFLIVGLVTMVAMGFGLFIRKGRPTGGGKAEPVEM